MVIISQAYFWLASAFIFILMSPSIWKKQRLEVGQLKRMLVVAALGMLITMVLAVLTDMVLDTLLVIAAQQGTQSQIELHC
jgi:Na+/serine symporter